MARFNKRKSHAQHMQCRAELLRSNGSKWQPLEAHRVDHHRPDDAYREHGSHKGINGTPWKGAKGKHKLRRGPSQPKV